MKTIKITTLYEVIRIENCNEVDIELFKSNLDDFINSEESVWELDCGSYEVLLIKDVLKKSLIKIY